jgi:hypothetical protein
MSKILYDENKLRKLWDSGLTHLKIAEALGCPVQYVSQLRERHNLPMRGRRYHAAVDRDPTPLEIEERKREIRERHFEEKRREL